jgi:DNA invertase Pin-like site-specific DNA recombinase
MENRPALEELLVAQLSNGVLTVIIEKLDRLAKDLMVQEAIIRDFKQKGFEIISIAEPDLSSNDATRKSIRQTFAAIAEYERTMNLAKLRAVRQRVKAKTGKGEERKLFGATESEEATISRMKQLAVQGLNYNHIANALNVERFKTQSGRKWFPGTVSRMLAK